MSSIKTVAGFAILAALVAMAFKAQRQIDLEANSTLAPMIESSVRMHAADFNPKVELTQPELRGFQVMGVQITRPRVSAILNSALGGSERTYEVYVRFRESDADRCMTLTLAWSGKTEEWKVSHPGAVDRCAPWW